MGRKRKTIDLNILQGNPGKRPLKQTGVSSELLLGRRPRCPVWLSDEAKKEWRRLAPTLEKLGLLTVLDTAIFAIYCTSYAEWIKAERAIEIEGILIKTRTGRPIVNPQIAISNEAFKAMLKAAKEMKMTPARRDQVFVESPTEPDELSVFLAKRNGRRKKPDPENQPG